MDGIYPLFALAAASVAGVVGMLLWMRPRARAPGFPVIRAKQQDGR